jgi:hypothetical protein
MESKILIFNIMLLQIQGGKNMANNDKQKQEQEQEQEQEQKNKNVNIINIYVNCCDHKKD